MFLKEEKNKISYGLITSLGHVDYQTEKHLPQNRALHLSFYSSLYFFGNQYFYIVRC